MNMNESVLEQIHSPADLKAMSDEQLIRLCGELRSYLVTHVTETGGHLASNLGVVELTVALHQVFDTPTDHLIFDVGHQCYVHKLLTGRRDRFDTIRAPGGLSGFTKRSESLYDPFGAGHSSTSVSAALGFAEADKLTGSDAYTIAIVGDGAFTGGLVHEALNNIDRTLPLLIILNENEMSISPTRGRFAEHLAKLRRSPRYHKTKKATRRLIRKIPLVGEPMFRGIRGVKQATKNFFFKSNYFEDMGLYYLGPVDGNDFVAVRDMLREARSERQAIILHIKTIKGKGYAPAEVSPNRYHGILPGNKAPAYNFSAEAGKLLCQRAGTDEKLCVITAAMAEGCGIADFAKQYPDRFFDVGIAEEHALVFAAGLAAEGLRPVFTVYSTFLQRGYDNLIHDIALQDLPVTVCIDRAGLAAGDGPTHHGIFDVAFLGQIPNLPLWAPADFDSLARALADSLDSGHPACVRYPNAAPSPVGATFPYGEYPFRHDRENIAVNDCVIVTYGRIFDEAVKARNLLSEENITCTIVLLEQLLPISAPADALAGLLAGTSAPVLVLEEGIKAGGLGMLLREALLERGTPNPLGIVAIEDPFATTQTGCTIRASMGIDAEAIATRVRRLTGNT
ncbi:MAG: 1-deoxy-D-xylulose-5-phosphate synthase [Clostridia bacterium]|nr:1-deoxy-D-xylulose-5-phosphate synthase [Clostridia bacterium]